MADAPTLADPTPGTVPAFPVVGIGASAGGLEALQKLLESTGDGEASLETGIAFVLVQHLDPNHQSMLADLLSRRTNMTVRQAEDGDALAPDTLFVIPPGSGLRVEDERLRLEPFAEPRGLRRPIDDFFISLSESHGSQAACVIVSGTGADGSAGLRAVKEAGGLVVVQDPDEAKYDGMPSAAINTGLVDRVSEAGEMLTLLRDYFNHTDRPPIEAADEVLENLDEVCTTLAERVGHDFSGYKHSTMVRRIRRRMQVVGTKTASAYIREMKSRDDECDALLTDLLINVTRFFRDEAAFRILDEQVIRPMVAEATRADTLRFWVPGCSSGEEAYTLALLIGRALDDHSHPPHVQIFATDIDEQMLATAKLARYPITALSQIPDELHGWCRVETTGHFTIAPKIRDIVRFSAHSLIKDPPFSRLNLISCRNLLIYLNSKIQAGLLPLFHYALVPGGTLFLGPAEGINRRDDLFKTVDSSSRLYERVAGRTPEALNLPLGGGNLRRMNRVQDRLRATPRATTGLAQRRLLDAYAPAYLTVSQTGEVLESSGSLAKYFDFPAGTPTRHVSQLARPGLREVLTQSLRNVIETRERMVQRDVEVRSEFGVQAIDLIIDPLPDGSNLVVIRDIAAFRASMEDDLAPPVDPSALTATLESELDSTRQRLRTTVEELETTNEELKSSNEEMMSMNEELQSANEELTTVNDELKIKIDRLAEANDDQRNFLASTDIALVVVDADMNIRVFTEAARAIYPLTNSDVGRPVTAFNATVDDPDLISDARKVLKNGVEINRTVSTHDGGMSYAMRLLPYRAGDGRVEGVSLTFTDTTKLRDARREAEDTGNRLELALAATGIGVWESYLDDGETVLDTAVRAMFGVTKTDTLSPDDVMDNIHELDRERVKAAFTRAVDERGEFREEFRIADVDPERWISGVGRMMTGPDGREKITGVNYDITDIKTSEHQQALLVRELDHRVKNLFAIVLGMLRAESRRTDDKTLLVSNIESRLGALSRAHEATRQGGVAEEGEAYGVRERTSIRTLTELVLSPYGVGKRVHLSGDPVALPAAAVTPMGLILHELATNAQKYGALSGDSGKVHISWRRVIQPGNQPRLEVRWVESGGPPVPGDITKGFGMRLVRQSVNQLGGKMEPKWPPGGLELELLLTVDP